MSLLAEFLSPEHIFLLVAAFASLGHHLPGFLRAYGDRELFRRFRWRFLLAPPAALAAAMAFSLYDLHGLELVLLLWATWHIMMQTYGILRIYDMKRGHRDALSRKLGFALCGSVFLVGIVFSDARVFGIAEIMLRVGLPLPSPAWLAAVRWAAALAVAASTSAYLVNELRRGWSSVSSIKLLLLLSTAWLYWTCGSVTTNLLIGVAMFEIFHALQYYAIVWTYNRRLADRVGKQFGSLGFLFRNRWYLLPLYIAIIAVFGSLRLITESVHEPLAQKMLLACLAASTLLHFYYDGFIWKVREWKTRQNLGIDGDEREPRDRTGWSHPLKWSAAFAAGCVLLGIELAGVVAADHSEKRQLATLAEWTPHLPELQIRMSQHHLASGDQEYALIWAQKAVALRPRSHEAQATAGVAMLRNGRFSRAAEHLQQATQLAPHVWENHYDLAQVFAHLEQWNAAETAFARAAELQPGRHEIHLTWGQMLLRRGALDRAVVQLQIALELAPGSDKVQISLVEAVAARGNIAEAIRLAEQTIDEHPRSCGARLCLGKTLTACNRWREAADCFQTAISLQPDSAEAHYQLGLTRVQLAEYPRALRSLRRAVALQPDHGAAHFQMGNVHYFNGEMQRTQRSYERSLELLPGFADAHINLGSVFLQQKDLESAAKSYRAALQLKPGSAHANYNLGLVLIRQDQIVEARRYIRRAEEAGFSPSPEVAEFLDSH